jgi:hypothetical protein
LSSHDHSYNAEVQYNYHPLSQALPAPSMMESINEFGNRLALMKNALATNYPN